MPIRCLVLALGSMLVLFLALQDKIEAYHGPVPRAVTTLNTMQRADFKFVTTHRVPKPRDLVKVQFQNLTLAPGDELALEIVGDQTVALGNPATSDVLTLDARNKAKGQLGSFPNVFTRCSANYNPNKRRLTFFCAKGTAREIPVDFASGNGAFKFNYPLTVNLYVNGTPFSYLATFEIRFTNRPSGPLTERGRYRN